ncbi:MAG TPA: DUF4142 domain-containing protein [Stellaceae bacterium]|nr:DUF4142 domain-containing protein [Stellaceae bacterium]
MKKRLLQSASFLIGVALSTAALAQPAPASGGAAPAPANRPEAQLSAADQDFVKQAAIGGRFEVEAGRLAEHSANSQVREFGSRMVRDHSAADAKLRAVAKSLGETLPQGLDQEHAQLLDRLKSLRGPEFSREYMGNMVRDHDQDVQLFRKEAHAADNPKIRHWAEQTLPVIESHDRMAHEIEASLMATGSSTERRR